MLQTARRYPRVAWVYTPKGRCVGEDVVINCLLPPIPHLHREGGTTRQEAEMPQPQL